MPCIPTIKGSEGVYEGSVIRGVACQILWPGEVGAYSEGECIIALAHI